MVKRYTYIIITLLALLALIGVASGSAVAHTQDSENQAGLVIQLPDGSTQTYCIPFTGESITGIDLLLKTGLEVKVEAYGGMGALVCKIGTTGCDYPDQPCACQSFGPGGVYWSYHHLNDGKWKTAITGAGSYKVRNGEVDGWAWSAGKPPALYSFSQLCAARAPQPTEAPTRTLTQTPVATPTTTSTHRPLATATIVIKRPTSTVAPTHKPLSPPTATTILPVRPTPTMELPQPQPTNTTAPTETAPTEHTKSPTITPTLTPRPTNTPTSTARPSPMLTLTLTPTPAPQPPIPNPQDTARNIGIAIGGLVLGSLVVWGILVPLRRGHNEGHSDVE